MEVKLHMIDFATSQYKISDKTNPQNDCDIRIGAPELFCNRIARILTMKQGAILPDRKTWSDLELIAIQGRCEIEMEDEILQLDKFEATKLSAETCHAIKALTDFRAVLIFNS